MSPADVAAWQTRGPRSATIAGRLYADHRTRLLAIAKHNSLCAEDAEEALHDAFVLFIDHFDPDGEAPPLAWLTLTLKRRCWALYRHQRLRAARHRPGAEKLRDPQASLEELAEMAAARATVCARLDDLKPGEREALRLLALGFSYREIGQLKGWTYTKVNRCVAEGRAALRAEAGPP